MTPFIVPLFRFLRDRKLRALSISTLSAVLTGTFFYHFVEEWRILDSFYFSAISLTTVGYGDLSPQTDLGKLFTVFYVLTGIGIIFGFINAFYEYRSENKRKTTFRSIRKRKSESASNQPD